MQSRACLGSVREEGTMKRSVGFLAFAGVLKKEALTA